MNEPPRVAIVGMILESNSFSPTVTETAFHDFLYMSGSALLAETRQQASRTPRELSAFVAAMDATGPWQAVPLVVAASPPGGPVDHAFFAAIIEQIDESLKAAGPVDAVYVVNHGAMTTTQEFDADGLFVKRLRERVGSEANIVMTLDLHANISEVMVDAVDCIVGYRSNPHVDQMQRGEEAAFILRQLLSRCYTACAALVRLPLTPASVTLLTHEGPYSDLINYGQRRQTELGGAVINVSVFGGFVFSDTPKNGLAVVVTARDDIKAAQQLAEEIASLAWSKRTLFTRRLMSIDNAISLSQARATQGELPAVIYSDAGDNPGGGGSGTTAEFLGELVSADATGVLYGCFFEPELAQACHTAGVGESVALTFNAGEPQGTGSAVSLNARILALGDGPVVGRRGIYRDRTLSLGKTAAITLGASHGITVVLISQRVQAADPVFFEMLGLDISAARVVIVKSRGHFRAGFDEWFGPEDVLEIDTVGYTSPVLERFTWRGLPRPVYPLDEDAVWTV